MPSFDMLWLDIFIQLRTIWSRNHNNEHMPNKAGEGSRADVRPRGLGRGRRGLVRIRLAGPGERERVFEFGF
jgi:hypothetical protein